MKPVRQRASQVLEISKPHWVSIADILLDHQAESFSFKGDQQLYEQQ